jgi:uncharacterized protein
MEDPLEGVAADGSIVTGVGRGRVPAAFAPVVTAAVAAVHVARPDATLLLYGSVATGRALPGRSDVDLVGLGLPVAVAADLGAELSARFRPVCRGVEIGPTDPADLLGDSDETYGNRVFLRHYCVPLAGPRIDLGGPYPADARAARGFNGDIAVHAARWRQAAGEGVDPERLARRIARKSLFAAAGLVSVRDRTWTTDRARAAHRWAELDPRRAADAALLLEWSEAAGDATAARIADVLDGAVAALVTAFADEVGLWS